MKALTSRSNWNLGVFLWREENRRKTAGAKREPTINSCCVRVSNPGYRGERRALIHCANHAQVMAPRTSVVKYGFRYFPFTYIRTSVTAALQVHSVKGQISINILLLFFLQGNPRLRRYLPIRNTEGKFRAAPDFSFFSDGEL